MNILKDIIGNYCENNGIHLYLKMITNFGNFIINVKYTKIYNFKDCYCLLKIFYVFGYVNILRYTCENK